MLWTLTNSPVRLAATECSPLRSPHPTSTPTLAQVRFGLIGSLMCRQQAETPDALERPSGAETETLEAMAAEMRHSRQEQQPARVWRPLARVASSRRT